MQGTVVIQGNPELIAELLSGRGWCGPSPVSRASIEAMKTVEVGQEEWLICLDELARAEAAVVVKEMSCRHKFHGPCIERWLWMHGSCLVCRLRMPPKEDGDSKKGSGEDRDTDGERRTRRREVWGMIYFR